MLKLLGSCAIKLLKTIPLKSMPAVTIEQRRIIYTENSGKIAAGIKELKQCLTANSVTETCGYISLELTSPSTSRPSTSTSDSDPSTPNSF